MKITFLRPFLLCVRSGTLWFAEFITQHAMKKCINSLTPRLRPLTITNLQILSLTVILTTKDFIYLLTQQIDAGFFFLENPATIQ